LAPTFLKHNFLLPPPPPLSSFLTRFEGPESAVPTATEGALHYLPSGNDICSSKVTVNISDRHSPSGSADEPERPPVVPAFHSSFPIINGDPVLSSSYFDELMGISMESQPRARDKVDHTNGTSPYSTPPLHLHIFLQRSLCNLFR